MWWLKEWLSAGVIGGVISIWETTSSGLGLSVYHGVWQKEPTEGASLRLRAKWCGRRDVALRVRNTEGEVRRRRVAFFQHVGVISASPGQRSEERRWHAPLPRSRGPSEDTRFVAMLGVARRPFFVGRFRQIPPTRTCFSAEPQGFLESKQVGLTKASFAHPLRSW
jgi:hypothetical protein